eukprot:1233895-Pleurochrysis_carterae.AAC.1
MADLRRRFALVRNFVVPFGRPELVTFKLAMSRCCGPSWRATAFCVHHGLKKHAVGAATSCT